MTDQTMQALTTDVENELLDEILNNLDQATISVDHARKLAGDFLALLPMQDKKDLLEKLYTLTNKFPETKELYLKYSKPIEEEERERKLTLMSEHIKNGKLEDALAVAKEGTNTTAKTT